MVNPSSHPSPHLHHSAAAAAAAAAAATISDHEHQNHFLFTSSVFEIEHHLEEQQHHQELQQFASANICFPTSTTTTTAHQPALTSALAEVAECRQKLAALGDRPDHVLVEHARHAVALIDNTLHQQLEQMVMAPAPKEVTLAEWRALSADKERQIRFTAEAEKTPHNEIIQLDELHLSFELLLNKAEDNLIKLSKSPYACSNEDHPDYTPMEEGSDNEIVRILKQAQEKSFTELDLQAHGLKHFPEAFGKFTTLIVLDLSYNELKDIPDAIGGLVNLQILNVEDNVLETLPDSIGLLKNLRGLNVSNNMLVAFPESLLQCSLLIHIEAGFNKLLYLPTSIGYHLVYLEHLSVQLNKLRALPPSMCKLKSLQYLDVSCNHLRSLPENLGDLNNLEILNASSNFSNLEEVPDSIGDLSSLIDLNLSYNQIRILPDSFGKLPKLRSLKLEENPLVVPPMDIVQAGLESVKTYMKQRWESVTAVEQQTAIQETKPWSRSGSWMSRWFSGPSASVALASGGKTFKLQVSDNQDYLQQQF